MLRYASVGPGTAPGETIATLVPGGGGDRRGDPIIATSLGSQSSRWREPLLEQNLAVAPTDSNNGALCRVGHDDEDPER